MAKSDDIEDDQVTLLNIKDSLKNYSPKRLKSLVIVMIDTVGDLIKDKEGIKEDLDN